MSKTDNEAVDIAQGNIRPNYLRKLADDIEDMGMVETAADIVMAAESLEEQDKQIFDLALELNQLRAKYAQLDQAFKLNLEDWHKAYDSTAINTAHPSAALRAVREGSA